MDEQGDNECKIEFLDEDADIVQQCVQNVEKDTISIKTSTIAQLVDTQLLVERVQEKQERQDRSKRKRKKDDDDSDYDPTEDIAQRYRRRRQFVRPSASRVQHVQFIPKFNLNIRRADSIDTKIDLLSRRKLQLTIPDYDDPLCLPVRALRKEDQEQRKLRNWNNLCLEQFKNCDTLLRAEKLPTVSSTRTVVLRNLHNKMTGKVETTMSAKLSVENKNGERKTEIVQSVFPKYREKKLLNSYRLTDLKRRKTIRMKGEVLLTKEIHKDVESLVVYNATDSMSLVYKIYENKSNEVQSGQEEEDKKYLKEVACCKICASCYQTSWRSFKNTNTNKKIQCHICNRPCISMYNLLAHLKSHSDLDVRSCKKAIARSLCTTMEYHYKCRICQEQFLSIKELRLHVRTHKGTELFKCEVCNNITS